MSLQKKEGEEIELFNPIESVRKHVKSEFMDAFEIITSVDGAINFETGAPDVKTPQLLINSLKLAAEDLQTQENPVEYAESFMDE